MRIRAKGACAGAAVLLTAALAGSALANTVTYGGHVTGHRRVIVAFELIGVRCPSGAHCFDHAKVTDFGAANFDYPNCPELFEGAFDFGNPNTLKPIAVKVGQNMGFGGQGFDRLDKALRVSFHGRFIKHRFKAAGWFEVHNTPSCSTGRLNWTATPGG
jgi:hypothetical protein